MRARRPRQEPTNSSSRRVQAFTKPRKAAGAEMSFGSDPHPGDRRHIRRIEERTKASLVERVRACSRRRRSVSSRGVEWSTLVRERCYCGCREKIVRTGLGTKCSPANGQRHGSRASCHILPATFFLTASSSQDLPLMLRIVCDCQETSDLCSGGLFFGVMRLVTIFLHGLLLGLLTKMKLRCVAFLRRPLRPFLLAFGKLQLVFAEADQLYVGYEAPTLRRLGGVGAFATGPADHSSFLLSR